jgi:hypothetical protein
MHNCIRQLQQTTQAAAKNACCQGMEIDHDDDYAF